MKGTAVETPTELQCEGSDAELAKDWQSIDWQYVVKQVGRLQAKISKAMSEGRKNDAMRFSHLLTRSFTAKALAVKIVSENKGSLTAGVDGVIWTTDAQKMRAVRALDSNSYKSKPLRRVEIPKKNGKMRPLGIPTMQDRAMQTLHWLALDPINEAVSDPYSYGFRKGRSTHDACERLFGAFVGTHRMDWALEGDIKGCFDRISHEWLMENIPMDRRVLRQFLKAGFLSDGTRFPTEEGTPQGGAISPTLANMTLNGMHRLLQDRFSGRNGVAVVRYADDFVVATHTKEDAEEAMRILIPFLGERGLELSAEKTVITHITDGFDFLGFNFRRYPNDKLLIKPSRKSFDGIREKVRDIVLGRGKAASQAEIIARLNPVVRGWCNYFRSVVSYGTFKALHDYICHILERWAQRRHSRRHRMWYMRKYWHKRKDNNRVFSCEVRKGEVLIELDLFSPKQMKIRRHELVRRDMNPYLDTEYFEKRKNKRNIQNSEMPGDITAF